MNAGVTIFATEYSIHAAGLDPLVDVVSLGGAA